MSPRWLTLWLAGVLLGQGGLSHASERLAADASGNTFYKVRRNTENTLTLFPEECFFPKLGLRLTGDGGRPDPEGLNGGKSFQFIEGWQSGATAEWGLRMARAGQVTLEIQMKGGPLEVHLGRTRQPVANGDKLTIQVGSGVQSLFLTGLPGTLPGTRVESIRLSGNVARDAGVLLTRWRPAAAHTKFSASGTREPVRLWVMEMDAVPGTLDFYSPITTPFGYYGPSWNADGTVKTSFNFSLWSYGRNEAPPPMSQWSHLLAVGHPSASFGSFGHEGTGVKVRDWEPLEGRQGQRQALALRWEPGPVYDTYSSYFYAADEGRWKLFGVGRKAVPKRPLESLWVGSFVEVPGPPPVQRTGPYPRAMRYRGWVQDAQGHWFPLDTLANGNIDKKTGLTHTWRGITEDGWFVLQTGGWTEQKPPQAGKDLRLSTDHHKSLPDYMQPEKLEALQSVPCSVRILDGRRVGNSIELRVELRQAGNSPKLTLFHGDRDALTLADEWTGSQVFTGLHEGENLISLPASASTRHIRALLENETGRFWSWDTFGL